MSGIAPLPVRAFQRGLRHIWAVLGVDFVTGVKLSRLRELERIGSAYGGWEIPEHVLTDSSICYCAGVGEDITFDLGLIEKYGCTVFAYDPTPRAVGHVAKHAGTNPKYRFFECGLWDGRETLKFYAPSNPDHVSHSILNLGKTESYFSAQCDRLSALMKDNGHEKIDLLKLDIEGAEYRVIDSIIEDRLDICVICVEYDEANAPLDNAYRTRIRESVSKLLDCGYAMISTDPKSKCNYTFVKEELLSARTERLAR